MRTTLAIDDDVLAYARAHAEHEKTSIGEIISSLARQAIKRDEEPREVWNGIPQLPIRDRSAVVTMEFVNRLRDELP